jgi:uncharacterized protein
MFREMRRKKQLLSDAESLEILTSATAGTLALLGDNGYPYVVPLSFVYKDGKIYFHLAREGHKVDSIRRNDKASFCIILAEKYSPGYDERAKQAIARQLKNVAIAELVIEHMTGKQAIELVPTKAGEQ